MLLVLSLDSVAEPLVEDLIAQSRLPNIARLRQSGPSRLMGRELEGAVYTTLFTGSSLADHGVHFPLEWSAHHQAAELASGRQARLLADRSIFRRIAETGRRVLVLDPPECAPHDVPGGVIASGIQFEARVLLPRWTRPDSVASILQPGTTIVETYGTPTAPYLLGVARGLAEAPGRLMPAWATLATGGEFDLVWITFASAHQAGHILFDDTTWSPSFNEAERFELTGSLARVYERIDAEIGRMLERLPQGSDILLLSAKGMGPNRSRVDLLPAMLDRILGQEMKGGALRTSPLWYLRSCVPASWRARGAAMLPGDLAYKMTGRLETLGRDWRRTRAFCPPCEVYGFVRFNLAGRERRGIVSEGEVRALSEEVVQGLGSFIDIGGESDGQPSVAQVASSVSWAGAGEALDNLPDLLVDWTRTRANLIQGVRSPRFGEIRRSGLGGGRAGNHCPGNLATLVVGRGQARPASRETARLEDVASTVFERLQLPAADLPGRPLFTCDGNSP